MTEVINMRNVLMNELNHGVFDCLAWVYLYGLAMARNCLSIACQVDRYIKHYEWNQDDLFSQSI
jgi:hypothetical protein